MYFNLSQHLHAPDRLQPGRDFRLSLYARHGRPNLVDLALPYLSTGPGSTPVGPLGVVGIDLSQAIALDPVVVPQPQGIATLTFSIPNNSGLLGLSIYALTLVGSLIGFPLLILGGRVRRDDAPDPVDPAVDVVGSRR